MKINALVFTLSSLMGATPAFAAEQSVTFSIPAMTCASCPYIIESAMGGVEGVTTVTANSDTRTALVTYDDAIVDVADIAFASTSVGYAATVVGSGS